MFTAYSIPSNIDIYETAIAIYALEWGFGERNSNLVAAGLDKSLIKPTRTVLFLDGLVGCNPREVTIHIGASNPGLSLFKALLVDDINGFITS